MKFVKLLAFLCVYICLNPITLTAQTAVPFEIRYNSKLRGELTLISNSIVNRDNGPGETSNDPYNGGNSNDWSNMKYIDVDDDPTTFSSSKSNLVIANQDCINIKYAGLYWGAIYQDEERNPAYTSVKFKLPGVGDYHDINADTIIFDDQDTYYPDPYACFADVTALVQTLESPVGEYTVANIFANQGKSGEGSPYGGSSGGWTLVIVYEDPMLSNKNVTIFDGFSGVEKGVAASVSVSGFTTIPKGPVNARIGVSCLEGEIQLKGDKYEISTGANYPNFTALSDAENPSDNFFNSSITIDGSHYLDRVPNSINNLGWDTDLFQVFNPSNLVIGNQETSATLRLETVQDRYYVFYTSFSVEIIEPQITVLKTVDDGTNDLEGSDVVLGQRLWYQLRFQNTGNDDAINMTMVDTLPINVDLDESSMVLPPGVTYTYIQPTGLSGGILTFTIPNEIVTKGATYYDIRFKVAISDECNDLRDACENRIENISYSYYTGKDSGTEISDDPSFYGLDACNFGITGSTNFLVDVNACTFDRNEVMCGSSLDLTAGSDFIAYVWKDASGNIIGDTQTITVTNIGVYTVDKTAAAPCVNAKETITVVPFGEQTNPLISPDGSGGYLYVDEVLVCPNDGRKLSEIYLCGTDDSRDIVTNIAGAEAIKWQKLSEEQEGNAYPNCPNTEGSSVWTTVDSTNNFKVVAAGEYRLELVFPGGCFVRYYFNVFKSTVEPAISKKNINCGKEGFIAIYNIDTSLYEFSVVLEGQPAGNFTSQHTYPINVAGDYTVYFRQIGVSLSACVPKIESIHISEKTIHTTITASPILCETGKGAIRVQVNDVPGDYLMELQTMAGEVIGNYGPSPLNDNLFDNLDAGFYQVIVTTPECSDRIENIEIKPPVPLEFTAALAQSITCIDGIIKVNSSGGLVPHYYAIHSYILEGTATWTVISSSEYKYQTNQLFDISNPGVYRFIMVDSNLCTAISNEVEIKIEPKISYDLEITDVVCFGDDTGLVTISPTGNLNGNELTFALDDGIVGNGVFDAILSDGSYDDASFTSIMSFIGLPTGNYTLIMRVSKGTSTCDFPEVFTIGAPSAGITGKLHIVQEYTCKKLGEIAVAITGDTAISGGTPPYVYAIDGVSFTSDNTFSDLTNGTYVVTVKDSENCVFLTNSIILEALNPPTDLNFETTAIKCPSLETEITVSVINGNPPFEYEIISPSSAVIHNGNNKVFTGILEGTYTIRVTDAKGCEYEKDKTINAISQIAIKGNVTASVQCKGSTSGAAEFTVSGYKKTYSYRVNGGAVTSDQSTATINLSNLLAGNYEVTVIDEDTACTDTYTVTVDEPEFPLILELLPTLITCNSNATIKAFVTGGWGAFNYKLQTQAGVVHTDYSSDSLFLNVLEGEYTVLVRDANGCVVSKDISIKAAISPTVSIVSNTGCYTAMGTIVITASGTGVAPLKYAIDGGSYQSSATFSGITPGEHQVSIIDGDGCKAVSNLLNFSPELIMSVQYLPIISCENTTEVAITANGGNGVYTYAIVASGILPSETDYGIASSITVTGIGSYDVYVKDGKQCSVMTTINVTKKDELEISYTATAVFCNGDFVKITAIGIGGEAPYFYQLENVSGTIFNSFQTQTVFNTVVAGNYLLRIKDANNCEETVPVVISEPEYLVASAGVSELVSCNKDLYAAVHITNPQGGTPFSLPDLYRYSFDGGISYTISNTQNLPSGTHTVYIKDANGCVFPMEVIVAAKIAGPSYLTALTYNCVGEGIFEILPEDVIPLFSYTYTLDGGAEFLPNTGIGHVFSNVSVGDHTVTMNFTPLATPTKNVVLNEDFGAGENTSLSNVSPVYCYEPQDGTGACYFGPSINEGEYCVTKEVTSPSLSWRSPNDISGMANGRFLVVNVVGDAGDNGVIYQKSVSGIHPNKDITISLAVYNLLKMGAVGTDPSITIQLTDSSGTVLLDAAGDPVAFNVGEVPKNNHADDWHQYTVSLNPGLITDLNIVIRTDAGVTEGNDIAIDAIIAYQEPDQCATETSVTFTVEDAKEFKAVTNSIEETTCNGGTDGGIAIELSNFNPTYGYKYRIDGLGDWIGPKFSNLLTVDGLTSGSHSIEIVYLNIDGSQDCKKTITEIIGEPSAVVVSAGIKVNLTCRNISTTQATIEASAVGGSGPYQYQLETVAGLVLTSFQKSPFFTNLAAGSYMVRARDVFGCEDLIAVPVEVLTPKEIVFTAVPGACYQGDSKGTITVSVVDGNGNYQFSINGNAFQVPTPVTSLNYTFENLVSGTYEVLVKDQYGCMESVSVTINSVLRARALLVNDIDCIAPTMGEITVEAYGGDGSYSYQWSKDGGVTWNNSNFAGNKFTNTAAGTYVFKVTDGANCSGLTKSIVLSPAVAPEFTLTAIDIACNGNSTGEISVNIDTNIGLPPYAVSVRNVLTGIVYGSQTTGLPGGNYEVTVTDLKGCFSKEDITIEEPSIIDGKIQSTDIKCEHPDDVLGTISIDAGGTGTAPYTYRVYNNGLLFDQTVDTALLGTTSYTFTGLEFGFYKIVILDSNGCENISEVTIGTAPNILVTLASTATCATGSIKVQVNTTSGSLSTGPYYFAIYPVATSPPSGAGWFVGVPGVLGNGDPTEEYTFNGLSPGVRYTFMVYNDTTKCSYIQEADELISPVSTLESTINTLTNVTCTGGSDGIVNFTISNYEASATQVDYQIFETITISPVPGLSGSFTGLGGADASASLSGLGSGDYFIQFTEVDGGNPGCITSSEPFSIKASENLLEIEAKSTKNQTCNDLGIVTAVARYGTGPYTYKIQLSTESDPTVTTWGSNNTTGIFKVPAGTYKVFVLDAFNCIQGTDEVVVTVDSIPEITFSINDASCPKEGAFEVTVSLLVAGVPPYSIRVNEGPFQPVSLPFTILNLSSGIDQLIEIQDQNACGSVQVFSIAPPLEFNAEITKLLDCSISPHAEITISDIVGSGKYTYEINGVAIGANDLIAGTDLELPITVWTGANMESEYIITVTDTQTNCAVVKSLFVADALKPIVASSLAVHASCKGAADGSIFVTAVDNGIGPFTFAITAPSAITPDIVSDYTATFNNLQGTVDGINYTVTITAANGCTTEKIIKIKEPSPVSIDAVNISPFGCSDGNTPEAANITVSTITGGSGVYPRVVFVNSDGDVVQDGGSNVLSIVYNVASNTYSVAMGSTSPGVFTIHVYDSNGCEATTTETILLFDRIITASIAINDAISCVNAGEDIQLIVVSSGADNSLFEFSDDAGLTWQGSPVFNDLAVGNHQFIIRHKITKCEFPMSHEVFNPNVFTPKVTVESRVVCKGSITGEVTFEIEDATYLGGFNWEIFDTKGSLSDDSDDVSVGTGVESSNGPTDPIFIGEGSYYVRITQYNFPNCNNRSYFTVTAPEEELSGSYLSNAITCSGDDGSIRIKAQGGWENYEYYVGIGAPSTESWTVSNSFDGLSVGTYQVWIRDVLGCEKQVFPDVVLVDPSPITASLIVKNYNCEGSNGEIEVTNVSGGEGKNYKYQLFLDGAAVGAAQISPVFTGLVAGNYHVDITDFWSCTGSTGGTITLYDVLAPTIVIQKEIDCTGAPEGELIVSMTGGSGAFKFVMTLPDGTTLTNTTGVFDDLGLIGIYTIRITDTITLCSSSIEETLKKPSTVVLLPTSWTDVKCNGGSDGTITINLAQPSTGSNDEPVYTYEITGPVNVGPQNSNVFSGLPSGMYTVKAISVKGCEAIQNNIEITEPSLLSVKVVATTFGCTPDNLTNRVQLTVSATGGIPDYLYSINGVDFTSSPIFYIVDTGLVQNITVTVKDANVCIANSGSLTINPLLAITKVTVVQKKPISCLNPEQVTITVLGGSGNFTFELLPDGPSQGPVVSDTADFELPSEGNYTFKVIDNDTGCYFVAMPYDVALYNTITVEATATGAVKCLEDANGILEFKVLNYTGNFTWFVNDSSGAEIVTGTGNTMNNPIVVPGLIAANYSVRVVATDPAFCAATSNVITIESPNNALNLKLELLHKVTCNPGSDGEIRAIATGGWGGYEFQLALEGTIIVPFGTDHVFGELVAGDYTVTLRDLNGCSKAIKNIKIASPLLITANASSNSIRCNGDLTGEIEVVATGGQGPGTYVYSLVDSSGNTTAFQSDNVFKNLASGTYTVLVSDDLSCDVITAPVTIKSPPIVNASATLITALSCTVPAQIKVEGSGGDGGPYTYSEDGIVYDTTNVFTLDPTSVVTYQYFVKDASACVSSVSNGITISPIEPLKIDLDMQYGSIVCFGATNAVISAITSGGLGNYMYELLDGGGVSIKGPQSAGLFEELGAGTYKIRVTSLDCLETSIAVTILNPDPIVMTKNVDFQGVSCFGEEDGIITIYATGGTGKLLYSIDQNKYVTSNVFSGLAKGIYTVSVIDENGCHPGYVTGEIKEPKNLEFLDAKVKEEKCINDKDGVIELVIEGGTKPYFTKLGLGGVYEQDKMIYSGLEGGVTYLFYVKDSNGCENSYSKDLKKPVALDFEVNSVFLCDGNVQITASVAAEYKNKVTYSMMIGTYSEVNNTGLFLVTNIIKDQKAHVMVQHDNGCASDVLEVDVAKILPLFVTVSETFVNTITAVGTGGLPPYQYRINGEDYGSSNKFIISETGQYTIGIIDARGCVSSALIDMEYVSVVFPDFFTPDGDGTNDYWYPKNLKAYPNITVSIFDRYSRLIAKFKGVQIGWDGKYRGKPLPSGDYWYVIDLDGTQGDKRDLMGNFTLYR